MQFENKKFQIENVINIHAYGHVIAPAEAIYDVELKKQFGDTIKSCHIYLIGLMPVVDLKGSYLDSGDLVLNFDVGGHATEIRFEIPAGTKLINEDNRFHLLLSGGQRVQPNNEHVLSKIHQQINLTFDVQYVGQAYGKDGSRNALDRLLKHETLQKIAVKGVPANKQLQLLMLQINPGNTVITSINPRAKDRATNDQRIDAGFEKLRNTSEKERITLFEASLIKYFRPRFNTEFKDSFPSTNLEVLKDCYSKDFASVVAEINFPDLDLHLGSEAVPFQKYHTVITDLHTDKDRQSFFFGN